MLTFEILTCEGTMVLKNVIYKRIHLISETPAFPLQCLMKPVGLCIGTLMGLRIIR